MGTAEKTQLVVDEVHVRVYMHVIQVGEKICNVYGRNVPNRRCLCARVFRLTAVTTCQIQREKPRGCLSACLKLRRGMEG